ncbi:DUF5133 domain-containing protein [Streptomyces sp. NPDC060048]|uniref:DUF5133 domain-containing protein n=1 Tax=unclassified Streptomyces TaxID=2593676 RepID=UPI0036A8B3E6
MNETPAPGHRAERTATGTAPAGLDDLAARSAFSRATGVVMALVPCTADTARRILTNAAHAAAATTRDLAENLIATHAHAPADPRLEALLRTEINRAQNPSATTPLGLRPPPQVLRKHLNHLRAARRRTLAAPHDAAQRAELDDAAYTLCVLMGQRNAPAALLAAEEQLTAHRLPPVGPTGPPQLPTR